MQLGKNFMGALLMLAIAYTNLPQQAIIQKCKQIELVILTSIIGIVMVVYNVGYWLWHGPGSH
jgi:hypothetical protein